MNLHQALSTISKATKLKRTKVSYFALFITVKMGMEDLSTYEYLSQFGKY